MAMSEEARVMVCNYLQELIEKVKSGKLPRVLHTSDQIDTGSNYVVLTQISYLEVFPYNED